MADRRIDLARARREAKALLAAARAGDAEALARLGAARRGAGDKVAAARPGEAGAGGDPGDPGAARLETARRPWRLADAQLAVARELGERSWPRLVRRAEAEAVARDERARQFVLEATDGRRDHAEALLAVEPGVAGATLDAALVYGDTERVRAALARHPGLATRPLGARGWLPLLYPTHSAFLGSARTDGLLECARALLDAGADPDSSWQHPQFGALSSLYGAAGVAHEPRMTALLLEAGANPDDDESVYHATEAPDYACLELLLAAGATVAGTNALARERPEEHARLRTEWASVLVVAASEGTVDAVRTLLALGVPRDARGELGGTALHHAAWRGRPDVVRVLLAYGADPHAEATEIGGTPLSWAAHGSHNAPPGGDWVAAATMLVEAGARPDAGIVHEAAGELSEWLADHLEGDTLPVEPWGEPAWEADAAWLRALAASDAAEVRPVGDGFAVRTGGASNTDNGVLCSRLGPDADAEIAAALEWLGGAPAQWLCAAEVEPPDLRRRLERAGASAERRAVAMGAEVGALALGEPAAAEPVRDLAGLDAWLAVAAACDWFEDGGERERRRAILAGIGLGPDAPVQHSIVRGAAFVTWMEVGRVLSVLHLAVVRERRRQGLGRGLLAHAVSAAPACTRVVLGPTPDSIAFYERLGFTLVRFPRERTFYLDR